MFAFHKKRKTTRTTIASQEKFEDLNPSFDPVFYSAFYPDLKAAGLTTSLQLKKHYQSHGKTEGRCGSASDWFTQHGLPNDLLSGKDIDLTAALQRTAAHGYPVTLPQALDTLRGYQSSRVWFTAEPEKNAARSGRPNKPRAKICGLPQQKHRRARNIYS